MLMLNIADILLQLFYRMTQKRKIFSNLKPFIKWAKMINSIIIQSKST